MARLGRKVAVKMIEYHLKCFCFFVFVGCGQRLIWCCKQGNMARQDGGSEDDRDGGGD